MMNAMNDHYEKLALAIAVGAVIAGSAWTWERRMKSEEISRERVAPNLSDAVPVLPETRALSEPRAWPKPSAQSAGADWFYELFTPPDIYYHAAARAFTVSRPQMAERESDRLSGYELLTVKRAPYRLQLAGYFGASEDYLVAFVSSQLPQTLLAREGQRFAELGLVFESFEVRKVPVESETPGAVFDVAAFATVHDERTGAQIILDSRWPALTDDPLALFQDPDGKGRPHAKREGDMLGDEHGAYRIERIQLDPPEVVLARHSPGLPVPEIRILRRTPARSPGRKVESELPLTSDDGLALHRP